MKMRGILWRWLFFFGAILWISLCLADYHQKYLDKSFKQSLKNMEIKIEPPAPVYYQVVPQKRKLHAPAPVLTFWKLLSIVFSVSAIVIIKRLSTFRKKRLPVASCSDFDLISAPYGSFITRIPPITNNTFNAPIYHQEFHVAHFETNLNAGDVRPSAVLGVKIVQKKLEDLENNIATLKQRISHKTASIPSSSVATTVAEGIEQKLAAHQNYFGPVITNTDSSHSSSYKTQSNDMSIRKEILEHHSRPVTPMSVDLTGADTNTPVAPATTSSMSKPTSSSGKHTTPEKSSRKSGGSSSHSKEVRFNCNTFELDNDMISLKELKDSMSSSGKDFNREARQIGPVKSAATSEKMKKEPSQAEMKSNPISICGSSKTISKRTLSRKSQKNSQYQISESKTLLESITNTTTCPSMTSRKSHDGSSKSFPMDGNSTTKVYTDSNSTSSLISIRKKRILKPKERLKEFRNVPPISTSIATYLSPHFQSASLPQSRMTRYDYGSYAAINRKRTQTLKELHDNSPKIKTYDQISISSSNDSTDSIDMFVAKILKPDSEATLLKHSSDELSMASTSISSMTDSSSTYISKENSKFDSVTNSIRSLLPLTHTTVSSNYSSSMGTSRNIPAGAEPLSSGESIVDKHSSKYRANLAIHSLAKNYLQKLESDKGESESQEKIHDSGSDFSVMTKSVLEKYKSKTKQSSANSSRQNILEDKYWLLHW